MEIKNIPLSILDQLTPMDIEEYLYNLKVYEIHTVYGVGPG
jgi:hypothetical protein